MGADIKAKLLKKSIRAAQEIQRAAAAVPIDCDVDIKDSVVQLHYGYWNATHTRNCETFIANLEEDGYIKVLKRSY